MANRAGRTIGCFAVVLLVLLAAGIGGLAFLRSENQLPPLQFEERCVATAAGQQVTLTKEQAYNVSIIAGLSVRRNLNPRAATIALATAYQESGLRNLEHGDRDSLGLFQQRPSQDWGSPAQIMDPWYSSGAFYDALVKVKGWESGDINDTAQAVQRSGHPEAYRKHEQNARILASAFTGQSAGGVSCFDKRRPAPNPGTLTDSLTRTFGKLNAQSGSGQIKIKADDAKDAEAMAAYAVAQAGDHGVSAVDVNGRTWRRDGQTLPTWTRGGSAGTGEVVITLR